jgi:hypothetical protein
VFFIVLCAEQLAEERVAQNDEFFQKLSLRFVLLPLHKNTQKRIKNTMFTSMAATTTSCSLNGRLLGKDDDILLFYSFLPRFSKAMSFQFFFVVVVSKGSDELYHQRAVKGVLESTLNYKSFFLSFFLNAISLLSSF